MDDSVQAETSETASDLGRLICAARRRQWLTQDELAIAAGVVLLHRRVPRRLQLEYAPELVERESGRPLLGVGLRVQARLMQRQRPMHSSTTCCPKGASANRRPVSFASLLRIRTNTLLWSPASWYAHSPSMARTVHA